MTIQHVLIILPRSVGQREFNVSTVMATNFGAQVSYLYAPVVKGRLEL